MKSSGPKRVPCDTPLFSAVQFDFILPELDDFSKTVF